VFAVENFHDDVRYAYLFEGKSQLPVRYKDMCARIQSSVRGEFVVAGRLYVTVGLRVSETMHGLSVQESKHMQAYELLGAYCSGSDMLDIAKGVAVMEAFGRLLPL